MIFITQLSRNTAIKKVLKVIASTLLKNSSFFKQ